MSTARTRRLVSSSAEMPSFVKIVVVYLLTAPSLTNKRAATAVFDNPSALPLGPHVPSVKEVDPA